MKSWDISFLSRITVAIALIIFLSVPAMAQNQSQGNSKITIDGARDPERIPDWILWREFFRVAIELAEKSPSQGRELWMDRLGLTAGESDQLVALAYQYRNEEAQMDVAAKKLAGSGRTIADSVKAKLHDIQAAKEKNILTIRDILKQRIGEVPIKRMESFARINIAPTIKVGKVDSGR